MDEDRRHWHDQFSSNFGAAEYVRFVLALLVWILMGVIAGVALRSFAIFGSFLVSGFAFPFVAMKWAPGYRLFRKILGNRNLPEQPSPGPLLRSPADRKPWWAYLPGIWFLILDVILVYLAIQYFSR